MSVLQARFFKEIQSLYTVFLKLKTRQCQQKTVIQWKGDDRKLIKHYIEHHSGAYSSLGTIDDSPLGGKSWVLRI